MYYRGAIGLFIIYDVTNLNSLHNLDTWMRNIDDVSIQNVRLIIVFNLNVGECKFMFLLELNIS